ncbi:MAG TPA: NAD(P)/FAD-dependent oxidoreductase [Alphaproteobacteria bacterium]|nr:NAD(P)/FAD-dependent oxidoreductase [Alphaproteobacteria bacterium]
MEKHGVSVGVLGAGLSGLLMGIRLKQAGHDNFVIYEKAGDVGGTWKHNTYPGLHCDVPSHLYSYSFEPNPEWTQPFASQAEIQTYLRHCAEKYGLLKHLRFGVTIDTVRYQAEDGSWEMKTADGETIRHRVIVSATGGLTAPSFPRIEGLDIFRGPLWHSAAWRHGFDFTGKRVAVIGSAASAVQVIPEVAKTAAELFVFQRDPNWVMPRNNRPYSEAMKAAFRDPATGALARHRRALYRGTLMAYKAFRRNPRAIAIMRHVTLKHMRSAISDPSLIAKLTPAYDPGCKRLLVSDDYYPALARPATHVIPHGVSKLTETSIVATDGTIAQVDVAIFCTGYKLGGREDGSPAVEVFGRGGVPLAQALRKSPEAYRGVAIPGFPNYFTIVGINGAVAYTSLFYSAEVQTDYILKWIQEIGQKKLLSAEVQTGPTHVYNEKIQGELQKMSWSAGCTNFYLDRTGRNVSFYPGTLGRMRRELRDLSREDYIVEHSTT